MLNLDLTRAVAPPRAALRARSVVAAGLHDRRQRRHQRGRAALPGRRRHERARARGRRGARPTARSPGSAASSPTRPATTCGAASSAPRARWASRPGSRCGSCPNPPAVATMLCAFGSVDDAAATVSGTIAAGDPARRARDDGRAHHRCGRGLRRRGLSARRRSRAARRARRAGRGVAEQVDAVREIATRARRGVGSASPPTTPSARCCGRAASRRSARSPASRPTTTCTTRSCRAPSSSRCCGASTRSPTTHRARHDERVPRRRRQPAPADRVRPAASPACGSACTTPGTEILETCIAAGGVLTGEHGVGVEKRDLMPLLFSPDDLDAPSAAARRVRSRRRRQPAQGAAARQPVRRAAASAGGHVDLTELSRRAVDARRTVVAVGGTRRTGSVGDPTGARDEVRAPAGVVAYEPADMTITVGAGTTFAELDARPRRARPGVPARPARHERDGRRCRRVRAVGHPPAAPRPAPRPRARGALRDRRRTRRQGRRPDGEERDRLRPAAPVGRLVRHARRARAGDVAVPAPRAGRAVVRGVATPPTHVYRPAADVVDGEARCTSAARAPRPTSTRKRAGLDRVRSARAPRRRAPRPHLGRARCHACARRRRSTMSAGAPSSASARCTSPPTTPARSRTRAPPRTRTAAGCCAKPGATASTAFGRPLPNLALMRAHQGRVRPDGEARTRDGCPL